MRIAADVEAILKNGLHKKKQKKNEVFVDFFVDNEQVVVGQKIVCTVRFYYSDGSGATGQAQINMPSLSGFTVGKEEFIERGSEKIEGAMYQFIERRWFMYAQEPGVKMIPSYGIDYVVHVVSQRSMFRFSYQEARRVQSNVVHLKVDPLPPCDTKVAGVGQFTDLAVSFVPQQIKEGEAAVLTVFLTGEGNSENIDTYTITGMPDAVKCYESKKYMVEKKSADDAPVRCFEFVIQGLRAGEWIIPEQQFTYFDSEKKIYVTLKSDPISFLISAHTHAGVLSAHDFSNSTGTHVLDKQKEEAVRAVQTDVDRQLSLNVTGQWYPVQEKATFSLYFFLLLLAAPLVIGLCMLCMYGVRVYYSTHESLVRSKRAFSQARLALSISKEHHNASALYMLCIRLIAQRCMVPEAAVSRSWISTMLESKGCSLEYREEWEKFLDKLSYYSFAQVDGGQIDNDIYAQVEAWITRLEKKI